MSSLNRASSICAPCLANTFARALPDLGSNNAKGSWSAEHDISIGRLCSSSGDLANSPGRNCAAAIDVGMSTNVTVWEGFW